MAIKCIVFDCDGVLLDSVNIKTEAFGKLAQPWGDEARDRMVLYHSMHGGVSRYLKFEWFFREYIGREITPAEKEEWNEKFCSYCLDAVRNCALIPGALATLKAWHGILPLYVCTGAPVAEVSEILKERGLADYFNGIYGSPPAKSKLLEFIVNQDAKLDAPDTLMVGDASTDLEAAEYAGTQFYAIGELLKGGAYPWSMNLEPLNDWIKKNRI